MTGIGRNGVLVAGLAAALAGPVSPGWAQGPGGNCETCHAALDDPRLSPPARLFAADVHATKGFGCVACHGGDASAEGLEGMDPAKGFVGRPRGRQVVAVCGGCHSNAAFMHRFNPSLRVDQVQEYRTSVHGQRLTQFGDTLVATCSSCHPAHRVRPPSDPQSTVYPLNVVTTCGACHADTARMGRYGIPTDQRAKYEASIHWRAMSEAGDASAPTCNDCHGNHGAAPPGVSWVGNVCGQCHAVMADLFAKSKHAETFTLLGVPGCATCHGNHEVGQATVEMLGLGAGAVCSQCHTAADAGGMAATAMRGLLDSLRMQFDSAETLLDRAENAGVEVSQALFELEAARNAEVAARSAVHAFEVTPVRAEVARGLEVTSAGIVAGQRALKELGFRRTGLAVSVLIILAVLVGLVWKIRQIESTPGDGTRRA